MAVVCNLELTGIFSNAGRMPNIGCLGCHPLFLICPNRYEKPVDSFKLIPKAAVKLGKNG